MSLSKTTTTPLARYLFTRLRQHGVRSVFGVPGDFTLKALDHLQASGLRWVGNCNELNAAYAADGYARARGLGAVFTTYGVGELSAINAIAGSYAEHVPVVHVVATPQRRLQNSCAHVHHTLGDGRPRIFAEMQKHVTVDQTNLVDAETAVRQIDRAIAKCLFHSRPVYIELPCDMVATEVTSSTSLEDEEKTDYENKHDLIEQTEQITKLIERIKSAKQALLLVDRGDGVQSLKSELNAFIKATGIPTLTMPSGGGMVDHSVPNYFGVHSGPVGQIDTMPYVASCDLIIAFGPMFSDTQTLGWKTVPDDTMTVLIGRNYIRWPSQQSISRDPPVKALNLRRALKMLTGHFVQSPLQIVSDTTSLGNFRDVRPLSLLPSQLDNSIDQTSFYLRVNSYLKSSDTVILGNATPILGGRDFVLPQNASMIASGMWFSIGQMLPAALGAAVAKRDDLEFGESAQPSMDGQSPAADKNDTTAENLLAERDFMNRSAARQNLNPTEESGLSIQVCATRYGTDVAKAMPSRVILFDGDGSFQTTCQELSTIIAQRLHGVTIFIINNSGYAYERLIHGMNEAYNDIAPWQYLKAPDFFGAPSTTNMSPHSNAQDDYRVDTFRIETWKDLDKFLGDEKMNDGVGLKLVEVIVGRADVPEKFWEVFKAAGAKL